MKQRGFGDNPWRAAALLGVMGIDVALCIFIGYAIGRYAGERLGGSEAWIIGGVLTGLAAGILTVVLMIRKVLEDTDG